MLIKHTGNKISLCGTLPSYKGENKNNAFLRLFVIENSTWNDAKAAYEKVETAQEPEGLGVRKSFCGPVLPL